MASAAFKRGGNPWYFFEAVVQNKGGKALRFHKSYWYLALKFYKFRLAHFPCKVNILAKSLDFSGWTYYNVKYKISEE